MKSDEQKRACIDFFRGEYEYLSNFYPAKLTFDGIAYLNSEAAYQAQKCATAKDRTQFSRLSADEAKRLGQKVPLRPDWDLVKLELMAQVVRAKFSQHPRLAKKLLETVGKPLIEGNTWHDVFWGMDLKTREGENHLGRILMALRQDFLENGLPDETEKRPVQSFGPIQGITVTDEDITEMELDCIVNAVDNRLTMGSGVSGAIHREAGPELLKACQAIGRCETGQAVLTEGYELSAKYVIHAVGPVYQKDDEALLAHCYSNCMDLARQRGIHSIAFPPLSTGRFCFPKDKAMDIAVRTLLAWITENPDYPVDIFLCCADIRIFRLAREYLEMHGKKRAVKSDWVTKPMEQPVKRIPLRGLRLSAKEYAQLSLGLIPEEMEDKWFIYLEDNKLYCHRSWTGLCAYIVEFTPWEGGYRAEAFLTPAKNARDREESASVCTLISFLAGNQAMQEMYDLQYETLSCPIGREGLSGMMLYSEFGMQVLSGLGNEEADGDGDAAPAPLSPTESRIDYEAAVKSGLYGVCVGDALGVPAEFRSRESLDDEPITDMIGGGAHGQPVGTWSDDSSMTLCLADSLSKAGGIHTHDIMERFARWWQKGEYSPWGECFDIGHTTAKAVLRYQAGTTPALCGGNKDRDNGNGSLMRILPLVYELYAVYGSEIAFSTRAMEQIHKISGLTHRHPLAQSACGIYVCIAARLLELRWETQTAQAMLNLGNSSVPYRRNYAERLLVNQAVAQGIREALDWYFAHRRFAMANQWWERLRNPNRLRTAARSEIRSGGYVVDTLEAALWCLLNTDNYADCVLEAVNLGRDTDTTAAVAGGLAGLAYGYDAIPKAWLEKLKGQTIIDACCDSLSGRCREVQHTERRQH